MNMEEKKYWSTAVSEINAWRRETLQQTEKNNELSVGIKTKTEDIGSSI